MYLVTRAWAKNACGALAVTFLAVGSAVAGPASEVASALDPGDPVDVHITVDYDIDLERTVILREAVGFPDTDPSDPVPKVKDLVVEGTQQRIVPRIELGVFTDLSLSMALPVVIARTRTFKLDQRDQPCIFPGGPEEPTCINRTNSSTISDGILPANGFDAGNPGGAGFTDADTLFRGPTRRGIDQIHFGLTWAPMNQHRDSTKPTWKLGAEARVAVGRPMRLDPQAPDTETSVGRGLHEVRLWTSFAKRVGWAEPYVSLWWQAPFATADDSAFRDLGFGQERPEAQQQAGTHFGVEATLWQRPEKQQRVTLDLSARLEAHFEGRAYSEMWEIFQYAGNVQADGLLVLDQDPTLDGRQDLEHPGVTAIENYVRLGGRAGISAMIRDHILVGAAFSFMSAQNHIITFAEAGIDLPTCDGTNAGSCEAAQNSLVNPGTAEVNPGHVPLIDLVGQRYFVDKAIDYTFLVNARFLF